MEGYARLGTAASGHLSGRTDEKIRGCVCVRDGCFVGIFRLSGPASTRNLAGALLTQLSLMTTITALDPVLGCSVFLLQLA